MKLLLRKLVDRRLWPLWVVVVSTAVLLPRLGSYGFWEPQEMAVAARALPKSVEQIAEEKAKEDAARRRDETRIRQQAKKSGEPVDIEGTVETLAQDRLEAQRRLNQRPPLADAMVKHGIDTFGVSEFGARFPFVLLAIITAFGAFLLGCRVRSSRAGLLAALILLACPLFIFQSRQLTSELGAMAGGVFLVLGAVGLCSPTRDDRTPLLYLLDAFYLVVGSGLAYYSSGFFVGVIAPMAAIAMAAVVSAFVDKSSSEADTGAALHLQIASALSLLVFVAIGIYFTLDVFEWVDAGESEFSVGGKTFHADGEYNSLIAGTWKQEGSLKFNFNSLFEQIGFGMFPWIALAPIAVARMASGGDEETNPLGARVLFAWSAVAWLVCTIALRKVGPVQYPAVPAIAVGVAVWMDMLLDAREQAGSANAAERHNQLSRLAPPLVALFVLFAALILAKDIKSFPAQFLQMHIDGANIKFPEGIKLHKVLMGLGAVFALCIAGWLYLWKPVPTDVEESGLQRKLRRVASLTLPSAIAASLLISIFLSQVWTPNLSTKLSSRATFRAFRGIYEPGDTLGIVGKATDGAKFYAKAPFELLSGRGGLYAFLKRPERVFALVKASELCPIHKESANKGFEYYVVDDTNADKIMISNRMWHKDVPPPPALHAAMRDVLDRNPLTRYILRARPTNIQKPLDINFDDKLQLIGVDMPAAAERGSKFQMRLYYEVLAPIRKGYQVFVHFDGAGVRFQGDHWPVKKRCGTNYWQPGAFVVDEFTVEAGSATHSTTDYQVWTGLFVGSAGNWENMKAVTGNPDDNNRVNIGTVRLK